MITLSSTLAAGPQVLAGGGIFGTIETLASDAKATVLVIGILLAVVFIIITAWRTKGAIGGIISSALAAMLFIWFLNNVDSSDLQDRVDDTIPNGAPTVVGDPSGLV